MKTGGDRFAQRCQHDNVFCPRNAMFFSNTYNLAELLGYCGQLLIRVYHGYCTSKIVWRRRP